MSLVIITVLTARRVPSFVRLSLKHFLSHKLTQTLLFLHVRYLSHAWLSKQETSELCYWNWTWLEGECRKGSTDVWANRIKRDDVAVVRFVLNIPITSSHPSYHSSCECLLVLIYCPGIVRNENRDGERETERKKQQENKSPLYSSWTKASSGYEITYNNRTVGHWAKKALVNSISLPCSCDQRYESNKCWTNSCSMTAVGRNMALFLCDVCEEIWETYDKHSSGGGPVSSQRREARLDLGGSERGLNQGSGWEKRGRGRRRRAACTLLSLNDGGEDGQRLSPRETCRTRLGRVGVGGVKGQLHCPRFAEIWGSEQCSQLETSLQGFVGKSERCYSWSFLSELAFSCLMMGSGWASVLKTQCSNGRWSSSENSRYRYLKQTERGVSA